MLVMVGVGKSWQRRVHVVEAEDREGVSRGDLNWRTSCGIDAYGWHIYNADRLDLPWDRCSRCDWSAISRKADR